MKFLSLIGLLLMTISCSQDKQIIKTEPDSVLEYLAGVGIFTGTGNFGELKKVDSKILTLKINNNGDESLVGPPSIDNSNFSIIYQSGCSLISPKKTCTLKVLFDAKGKTRGKVI